MTNIFQPFPVHFSEQLQACGVDACGLVDAESPAGYPRYVRAVASGVPEGLHYLQKSSSLRASYEALLPNTRSILCVAVRIPNLVKKSPWYWASFCSKGDYHQEIRLVLERVLGLVRNYVEIPHARICVDSAPILERDLASRAGIGFVGCNQNVISPTLGSFILLGELLLDIDLLPWKEHFSLQNTELLTKRVCPSSCLACHRACPTGALSSAGYNVWRCLAYWTTQHRGDIPDELCALLGDRIWGCDSCQLCCPYNVSTKLESPKENTLTELTLESILCTSTSQLRKRLSSTPLSGAHPSLLQRNACIVCGNLKQTQALELLTWTSREHQSEIVRHAASWAIRRI